MRVTGRIRVLQQVSRSLREENPVLVVPTREV